MLNKEIKNDKLFLLLRETVNGLGLELVDVKKTQQAHDTTLVSITISSYNKEVGIDDCALVHRAVQPLLELEIPREVLSMEVSTPGIQRNFRDCWEFEVFKGKRCRVYTTTYSSWVTGIINKVNDEQLILEEYEVEDTSEKGSSLEIAMNTIQKAKLEHKWEDVKNVRVK